MNAQELRPMGIGDILDTTFRLYRQRFLTFLLIALVVFVPYALFIAGVQAWIVSAKPVAAVGGAPAAINIAAIVVAVLTFLIFAFILLPLCGAALVQNISAAYLGENLSAGGSYGRAAPRLLSLLGTQILTGLVVLLGFCLLIVPGIIFSLWFFVVVPVVILEGLGGTPAMGRSRELMRGNLGKAFGLALVVNILVMIISAALGFVGGRVFAEGSVFLVFYQNAIQAILLPIQTAPIILLYYDLRIRKEAFDLQKLSETMNLPVPVSQ